MTTEREAVKIEYDLFAPLQGGAVRTVRDEAGMIRAVEVCSDLLGDHLWMLVDPSFEPRDGLAIYYASEIPLLKGKTSEDLKQIHAFKVIFPGTRLLQDGPEPKRKPRKVAGHESKTTKRGLPELR